MRHSRTSASRLFCACVSFLFLWGIFGESSLHAAVSGEEVYQKRCAPCHDQPDSPTASHADLRRLRAARILRPMAVGVMMCDPFPLSPQAREAGAGFPG